jgi:pimeloyl-ACP methyl ester carboxylesterase
MIVRVRAWSLLLVAWSASIPLAAQTSTQAVHLDTLMLHDDARGRTIPVAFYSHEGASLDHQHLVLLSHGYNENLPGTYLHYSFLAGFLAEHGYFVVSIQHELPGDEPLPMNGNLRELRMPNWERGAQNILFVLNELKRTHPDLDFSRTTLIGHSNGGDMSVLFAQQHPDLLENLITLDNRRMPLPRSKAPRVLSFRSNDAPADEGVLPTRDEGSRYGIRIVPLNDTRHNEMSDRGNRAQREGISRIVLAFLEMANDR